MGRGNALPHGVQESKFFYVDFELIYGEDYYERKDFDLLQIEYEDWKEQLRQKIMNKWDSFWYEDSFRHAYGCHDSFYVLCQNSLVNIELFDNQWSMMIAVTIPKRDYYEKNTIGLAYNHMVDYYEGLIEIFKEWYDLDYLQGKLCFRTSAWTSGTINVKEVA
jgi:hypothetical protein